MDDLVTHLGHEPGARVVIVSADLMGTTHAATVGTYRALRDGVATTATLVMPGPWSRHAARLYRGDDIGVHLTLNAELDCFRWGPLTAAPSLLDGDGGFPRTPADLWDHADVDEVRRECRAQIERAVLWGFDVTHLTTHLGTLQNRPEFFDVFVELAVDFDLPIRLDGAGAQDAAGFPFRRLAADEGLVAPDRVQPARSTGSGGLPDLVDDLPPGVTELVFTPAVDTDELAAADPDASRHVADLDVLVDGTFDAALAAAGVVRIGYRELRAVQRSRR